MKTTYVQLQPVYSVSFLNFNLLQIDNFHSTFQLLKKENPEIALTKDLEIHI
ncbi:MAG: PD-(D/E)XK nuclease family transposase, partial [Leptospiraceae bacterium]|nr:PD-(D/E)XK nuclease family transposase [Leptospiraceae bacterium]